MQKPLPISPPVFTYLGTRTPVHCHEHVAVVSRGGVPTVWAGEFVSEGLRLGHHCCYLAPSTPESAILTRLGGLGIDVDRYVGNRALQFPPSTSDAIDLMDWAQDFFAEAETARAPAIRWIEEGVGSHHMGLPLPRFFEQHGRLNYLVKQYPSVAICHYDIEHLEVAQVFSAIAVHRHLLVEDTLVRNNPFYLPAEKFLAMDSRDRDRDLREVFRAVGFDLEKLLSTLAGYGRLQRSALPEA